MPIKFYRTFGEPTNTFPNSEEVHFSDNGYIYVADLNGVQKVMYGTAINNIVQEDSKSLSFTKINGDQNIARFDFYSTGESDARYVSQVNPMIGDFEIYHEGNQPPGMMTQLEKTKLLGISPGAEVNQFAFSRIVADGVVVDSQTKKDTLRLVPGVGVSFTVDAGLRTITLNSSAAATMSNMGQEFITEIEDLAHGDVLMYDANSDCWKNGAFVTDEIYFKSPNGKIWSLGVQDDGVMYIENVEFK